MVIVNDDDEDDDDDNESRRSMRDSTLAAFLLFITKITHQINLLERSLSVRPDRSCLSI